VSGPGPSRRDIGDAIFADEVGIEYGVYGEFRLWSAYQPIFAPENGFLRPVAVEALIEPHRLGRPVVAAEFFASVPAIDQLYVEAICRGLHLRNFRNIGVEDLDLFFNYDPRVNRDLVRSIAEIRSMTRHLDDLDLHPRMLVCEITEQASPDDAVLLALVREMRRSHIRIAIDDFGAGHSTEARMNLIRPDIVKIDGDWFAELCRHATAERFFRPLVETLHHRGATVLVEGIEEPAHLRVALEGGVDLLQGFYLGRPKLAGMIFDEEPLPIASLIGGRGKVIPLFGTK
jgi:EAL domain-containing protein (putative c-di-GMP-specific phosphodiesterase class I)